MTKRTKLSLSSTVRRSKRLRQSRIMKHFSTLAGSYVKLNRKTPYTVAFNPVIRSNTLMYRIWTRFIAYGSLVLVIIFGIILIQPAHWVIVDRPDYPLVFASILMLVCLILLQLFMIIGAYSSSRSTLKAKDPVPVRPQPNLRVAFATTRAPGEPVAMVRATLEAANAVRYKSGKVDLWLLDETNEPELAKICKELSVNYFSRKGIEGWNTTKKLLSTSFKELLYLLFVNGENRQNEMTAFLHNPFYAAKSKHGNFNAWRAYLKQEGVNYDILAGVDTDQIPEPNYLERLLGYFRDENVAFVVGPQVYGNYIPGLKGLVARWAESQASFFQSTIQRAGNASQSAMFVGTNYAVRMKVMDQIGGFQPCITEDMATGLMIHAHRNLKTGKRWKSVYTPDVLAVGEGPDFWGPYFTQQWRWAAGTFDTWRRMVWKIFFKLSPRAMLHYFLILTYYPMSALTWLLGIVSSMTYLLSGATAIIVPWNQFISLFMMLVIMQLSLYFWNRRYNVSPHEPEGSFGVAGMLISVITAPIYLSALIGIIVGKKVNFVVTTKGSDQNLDSIASFKIHLQWALILIVGLTYGILSGNDHPAMFIWAFLLLVISTIPVFLGLKMILLSRKSHKPVATNKYAFTLERSEHV